MGSTTQMKADESERKKQRQRPVKRARSDRQGTASSPLLPFTVSGRKESKAHS